MNKCGYCGTQHIHPTPQADLPYVSPPGFNDTQHDTCSVFLAHRMDAVPNSEGWLTR